MFNDDLFLNDPKQPIQMAGIYFRPEIFNALPASDQLFLWRRSRAVTIWNQRAALLKAVIGGLQGPELSDAERDIELINNWFARKHYEGNIDAATGQAVTPLIDPQRLDMLADQNRQAAQDIAASSLVADLLRIATGLANAARNNIGGPQPAGFSAGQASSPWAKFADIDPAADAAELLAIAAAAAAAAAAALARDRLRRIDEE